MPKIFDNEHKKSTTLRKVSSEDKQRRPYFLKRKPLKYFCVEIEVFGCQKEYPSKNRLRKSCPIFFEDREAFEIRRYEGDPRRAEGRTDRLEF